MNTSLFRGAREAHKEAQMVYNAFGKPGNLAMVEDDSKHWMTLKIRERIYSFFMTHFNISGDTTEVEAEILTPEELTITPTGQIATWLGGKMIFDLNKEETAPLIVNLENSRANIENHLEAVRKKAIEISGYITPGNRVDDPFINGRYQRDGYTVGKYAIRGEGYYPVPFLLFVPDDTIKKHPALIYLNPKGKAADAKPGGEIEKLVRLGYIVAATDYIGIGETSNTAARGITDGYTAVMLGRSVVAIQAGDIVRMARYLRSRSDTDPGRVGALASGEACIPLLHAAAFDSAICNITLLGPLVSFRAVVMNNRYRIGLSLREGGNYWHPHEIDFSWGVGGVLQGYDLPDLIGCIAPRKVLLADVRNQMLEPASSELITQELDFPRKAFLFRKASEKLKVETTYGELGALVDWSFLNN